MTETSHLHQPRIGIIGGGQLGCMLIQEAARYDIVIHTLDAADAPARHISRKHLVGSLLSKDDIIRLAETSEVITFEIENINVAALFQLEEQGKKVIPNPSVLQMIQDKSLQKKFYHQYGLPTASFVIIDDKKDLGTALEQLEVSDRFVIKTATGGYDGKGVYILSKNENYIETISHLQGSLVIEKFIPNALEISVITAMDQLGNIKCFPAVEMVFDPKLNLVDTLICPTRISKTIIEQAEKIAIELTQHLSSPGLFAVEMFVTEDGNIYINETAPRPHNSGHHTIEACYTSQYEQLLRVLMGWPLGNTDIIQPSSMINIIGPEGVYGKYALEHRDYLLREKGVYIHMYGKEETRPGRKLGHITILADNIDELLERTNYIKTKTGVIAI